jgi:hypothetical protein
VAGGFIPPWLTGIPGNILLTSQAFGYVNPSLFGEIHPDFG